MKKKYLVAVGLLVLAAATGCGKSKDEVVQQPVQATPTATPVVTQSADLVDMEVVEEENIMGEKTASASKATIINRTGSEVGAIYIRQHVSDDEEDDEWGEDLVDGQFTLKNGEQAVYYYKKPSSAGVTYDIRITYTEEDKNECFFRDLPLAAIRQITLRMSGTGEDAIPYATYMTSSGKKEVSTLEDVKRRLGLTDDGDKTDDDEQEGNPTPTSAPDPTSAPEPTQAPDDSFDPDNTQPTDDTIDTATGYIGQSMDALIGAIGSPQYDEYEEEPDTGRTGYHYYSNFTVSTTVDENGNEIVTGIW